MKPNNTFSLICIVFVATFTVLNLKEEALDDQQREHDTELTSLRDSFNTQKEKPYYKIKKDSSNTLINQTIDSIENQ